MSLSVVGYELDTNPICASKLLMRPLQGRCPVIQDQQSDIIHAYMIATDKKHAGIFFDSMCDFRQQKRCALKSTTLYQLNHLSGQFPRKHLNSQFSPTYRLVTSL